MSLSMIQTYLQREYLLEMSPSFAIATGLALEEHQIQIKKERKAERK